MEIVIYKIYDREVPNICYIGSTRHFNKRKSHHKKNCKNTCSKHYNHPLYKYIRAIGGWDYFSIEIIHKAPIKSSGEGLQIEQKFIDDIKPLLNCKNSFKH